MSVKLQQFKAVSYTHLDVYKRQITASAGNHAQGVAYAAKCYGAKATIVMPTTTPLIKVNRTKGYGAEVVLYGDVYDEACAKAYELAEEHGYTLSLIHICFGRAGSFYGRLLAEYR